MRDEDKTKQDLIAELRALRAEVALQNEFAQSNDKKLWAMLNAIHDLVIMLDAQGNIVWINRLAADSGNVELDDTIGKTIYDFLPADIAASRMSQYRLALKNREIVQFEDEREGLHFHHSVYPIFNDDGQNDYVVIFVQDITSQREAHKEREEAQRYLDAAASMLVSLNCDEEISLINNAGYQLLGYEKGELLGKNWFDTCIPVWLREDLKKVFRELLTGNIEQVAYYENPVLTKSGEERLIGWHNNVLMKNGSGEIEGILSSGVDITERKQAEIALQTSEAKVRAILEVFPDMIFRLDRDGTRLEFYAPSLSQTSVQPDLDTTIYDVMLPDIAQLYMEAIEKTLDTGQIQVFEYALDLERQGRLHYEARMVVAGEDDVLVMVRDITERVEQDKRQVELLVNRERIQLLEDVISDLSHDIKTPLTSMKTSLYLLGKHTNPEKRQIQLNNLNVYITRLNKLVDNIVVISRLDKGTDLSFAAVNINLLLENTSAEYHSSIQEKGIVLSLELDPSLPYAMGSEDGLERVIANLLENAITYTSTGESIVIRSYLHNAQIVIEIQDTGIGISEADLAHISERFYRADKSRNSNLGGTGLGLAITKKIVELHGGQMKVESTLGQGSTFRIYLPIQPDDEN